MAIATKLSELVALRSGLIQQINHDYGANLSSDSTLTDCLVAMLRTKAVVYDFTSLTALPENYTLTRNSIATYFNSSGVLTTAAVDEARFNYSWDGSNWVNEGLYVEKESTNIYKNSNNANTVTTKTNVTTSIVNDEQIGNVNKITVTAISCRARTDSYPTVAQNTYVRQMFLKYGTYKNMFTAVFYDNSSNFTVNLNLLETSNTSATVSKNGDWSKLTYKRVSAATASSNRADIRVNPDSSANNVGLDFSIGFIQEEQANFGSSLIQTQGVAVTRTRDYLSINSSIDQSVLLKYKSQLDNSIQTTWVDLVAGNNTLSNISGILLQKIIECKQLLTDDQKDWYGSRIL